MVAVLKRLGHIISVLVHVHVINAQVHISRACAFFLHIVAVPASSSGDVEN